MASKKELRKAMNARLHGLTAEEKAAASAAVCARLAALPQYRQASSIMAFLHMPDEVSLDALIKDALAAGKEVYVPVCVDKQHIEGRRLYTLEQAVCGAYGIRTAPPDNPRIEADELDVIFVPGLDRFLAGKGGAAAIAAAWDVQIIPDVPVEAHDVIMTDIVTDKQHLIIHP